MQVWLASSNGQEPGERLVVDPGEAISEIGMLTGGSLLKPGGTAARGCTMIGSPGTPVRLLQVTDPF
jgi:hypothetical protein